MRNNPLFDQLLADRPANRPVLSTENPVLASILQQTHRSTRRWPFHPVA